MDWIVATIIGGGAIWLASLVLPHGEESAGRCFRCGAPLEINEQALERLRLELTAVPSAICPVCGEEPQAIPMYAEDEWWVQ